MRAGYLSLVALFASCAGDGASSSPPKPTAEGQGSGVERAAPALPPVTSGTIHREDTAATTAGEGPSAAGARDATDDAPGCTMERIRAVVAPQLPAVTACYRAAAQADPAVKGRLSVELGIERDGRLLRRSVHESELPTEVNACVIGALEGLRFPGRFDTPCVVVYPFVFSAGPAK